MTIALKPDISKQINSAIWLQVEDYYRDQIDRIHIPDDPKPNDITQINAALERLYHEARLDYLYTQKAFDRVDRGYKMLKRALWPIAKVGKNVEERDHLLQDHLMNTPMDQLPANAISNLGLPVLPVNIYLIYETYKERMDYMKAILDIISDKTSRLITDSGAMKIESMLGH